MPIGAFDLTIATYSRSKKERALNKKGKTKTSKTDSLDWESLSLWPNQRQALHTAFKYLEDPKRAALVQMPTGTGKTGVMAVLARVASQSKAAVLVSPSIGLTEQLTEDIAGGFWSKIGADKEWIPKKVQKLLPSREAALQHELDSPGGLVLIGTVQALEQIQSSRPKLYEKLRQTCGVVLVDEGHREPAPEWADAVRSLAKPTVLFSATPYRNDLKIFDVNEDFVYFLSFSDAVNQKLIRDVDLRELGSSGDASAFVAKLVGSYDDWLKNGAIDSNAKVIVRCAHGAEVSAVYSAFKKQLNGRKEGFLAIHDRFKAKAGARLHRVPRDLRSRDEVFLIHQYKLMEGIDDPKCSVLAIFTNFKNERQLVQQIGRVIRHPAPLQRSAKPAIIVSNSIEEVREMWNGYLDFDAACVANQGKPPVRNSNELLKKIIEAFPESDYVGGRFRRRAAFSEITSDEIAIPKSCIVFKVGADFEANKFTALIRKKLEDEDRIITRDVINDGNESGVFLSLALDQSPVLPKRLFADLTLHVTAFSKVDDFLFVQDTGGLFLEEDAARIERLSIQTLRKLLPEHKHTKITALSLLNSDIGPGALRSRTFTAASLSDSVPFMGDHLNFVSRAGGKTPKGRRRYLGLSRSRLREGDQDVGTLQDFIDWTVGITQELRAKQEPAEIFSRFAAPVDEPVDPSPVNILLDISEVQSDFLGPDDEEVSFDETLDVCMDVLPLADNDDGFSHFFELELNGNSIKVLVRYDPKRKKYMLHSEELDLFTAFEATRKISLTRLLNHMQSFRVIPASPETVYAHKQFYSIALKLQDSGAGTAILNLLTPLDVLRTLKSEKGDRNGLYQNWPEDSLFRFINDELVWKNAASAFGSRFSGLVCDDLGDEMADFIGIDESTQRIAFVHAKTTEKGYKLAASALYDVCGQAIKNLVYLRFGASQLAGSANKWNQNWKLETHIVESRIRCGPAPGADFRARVRKLLANPNTRREAWLVLGNLLSRGALKRAIERGSVDPSLLQSYYLLMSTYSACKSVGVDLRVFCSE